QPRRAHPVGANGISLAPVAARSARLRGLLPAGLVVPAAHQRHVRFGVSGLNRGVPVTTSLPWKGTTMKLTLIFTLLLNAWAWPAAALNFFELEVYPATTEGQGLHEIESHSSVVANGRDREGHRGAGEEEDPARHHLVRSTVEYNYGLTDKI